MEGDKWKVVDSTEGNSDDDKHTMELQLRSSDPQEYLELNTQFAAIIAEVEISDADFLRLTTLMKRILNIVRRQNSKITMATLFRHNYLKVRNAGSNQILVYISGSNYRPLFMLVPELENLFKNSYVKPFRGKKSVRDIEAGVPVLDIESDLIVGVVTHGDYQTEVITCQLAKHLLDFDPRAKSLISLVHYWARLNDVTLSKKKAKPKTPSNMPDPVALEWLCLFFLGQEKVIPTLQKLRNRAKSRKDVVIIGRPEFNIDFPTDPGFIEEWRSMKLKNMPVQDSNEYVLEVLLLAHGFFNFCSKNNFKGKVLNTINGELLPLMAAIEEGLIVPSLNADNCKDKSSFELMRKKALALEAELAGEIYLKQPFHFQRFEIKQLKFENEILPLMEMTRRKLKFYLKCHRMKKEGTMVDVKLKSLLEAKSGRLEVANRIIKPVRKCPSFEEEEALTAPNGQPQNVASYSQQDSHHSQLSAHAQYVAIRKEVEIPDQEFLQVVDLMGRIQKTANKRNSQVKYTTIFRHNYLKLRNAGSNDILIYISEFQHEPLNMIRPEREVERLFQGSIIQPLPETSEAAKEKIEIGFPYFDKLSGLKFGLVTDKAYQVEVITCQLAKYLFKFDPRAKSFITLIHFWAGENKVTLSDPQNCRIPDPTALEWLCLFFLGRENLVPTLKKLRTRAEGRKKIFFEGNKKFNIAFPNDIHFIGDWKEKKMKNIAPRGSDQYVVDLLKLIQRFFAFCSGNEWEGNVLNTEDGGVIPLISAIEEGLIEPLDVNKCKDKARFRMLRMRALALEGELKGELYLMQPFLNKRFEICQKKFGNQVRPLMEKTGRKLKAFLERVEDGNGAFPEVDLRSLFQPEKSIENECEKIIRALVQQKLRENEKTEDDLHHHQVSGMLPLPKIWNADDYSHGISVSVSNNGDGATLLDHFRMISEEVVMPDDEWEATTELIRKLSTLYASNGFPNCELIPIRNRYLKLQPMDPEAISVFFLDHPVLYSEDLEGARRFSSPGGAYVEYQIWRVNGNERYSPETKRLLLASIEPLPNSAIGTKLEIPLLSFEQFPFYLATPSFLPEAQTSKMIGYLSTFDARVKPLMTAIFYWAKVNKIRLGNEDQSQFTVGIAPDPALLEWLVIFFLCEKKILPPPSEISERNGDSFSLHYGDVDIGVKVDQKYAREWWNRYKEVDKEQHVLNVFVLAQEFFSFWNKFGLKSANEPMIIDLKNGRSFEKKEVTKNSDNIRRLSWVTGISIHDLNLLKSEPAISQSFYSPDERVTIIHPLYVKYGFSFCWKSFLFTVCPKMGATSRRLNELLNIYKTKNGNPKQFKTNCAIETIFKVCE
ncbi:unnamed protein product [Orchesella dallaii]|uniref:Uncharacterized protein n=1 Tax=Orchesella dallaii TaxID=48710 RepID=A0ABP1RR82_9HEXA